MSCFLLPSKLLHQLTQAIRSLFWSNKPKKHKIAWISWKQITQSKNNGGLGIRDFKDFNIALLAKQGWRLLSHPKSLLARVFQANYYPGKNFLNAKNSYRSSYAWKSILAAQNLLRKGIVWNVGSGHQINIWKDSWIWDNKPRAPRPKQSNHNPIKVSDLFITGTRA